MRDPVADIPAYDFQSIEKKWQQHWAKAKTFAAPDRPDPAKKYYVLEMFPYPSGNLHMGHVRNYAIGDLIARFARARGKQVMHPMGWDAFGMPAENAAIKDGVHPSKRTPENIANVKRQMQMLGLAYDWDREIGTYLPEYYRWNQWFFVKFLERGLIYKRESEVNWCPKDQTVLANEQVEDGRCWRCDTIVERKKMPEWAFKITAYAQALLDGVETLVAGGWPDRVTSMQRNWIGKSVGLECDFAVEGGGEKIRVFTTRADTIHGATYVVIAPEHAIVPKITTADRKKDVDAFVAKMKREDKIARTAEGAPKEGVFTGSYAKNPFTGERVPVWLANFVLADYGTGAVMSVPAHDERDFEFAKKYSLPIRVVIAPKDAAPADAKTMKAAFVEDGVLVDSKGFSGTSSAEAREKIAEMAERGGFGVKAIKWHLRDWGFSRQRYWGTPIPIVNCPKDGAVPVPENDLPVLLPKDVPLTGDAGPPLGKVESFWKTKCPKCGGDAKREVETMDTFVDSAWYFARFLDPKNDRAPFAREKADAWLPVDIYIGGPEHAVLHLMYFRFWTMVMKELGLCATSEPVKRLVTQGIVYAPTAKCPEHGYVEPRGVKDGKCPKCGKPVVAAMEKMSKSKLNGVAPDELCAKYGADTARVYSLFASPPEKDLEWDDRAVSGPYNFLAEVWKLAHELADGVKGAPALAPASLSPAAQALWRRTHQTIKAVTEDIGERFHYNTGVSSLMKLKNEIRDLPAAERENPASRAALRFALESLLVLLAPYAPHIAEELWEKLGHRDGILAAGWPSFDAAALEADTVTVVVQVNGKLRAEISIAAAAPEADAVAAAKAEARVKPWIDGKQIVKAIYVPKKLVNLVVK